VSVVTGPQADEVAARLFGSSSVEKTGDDEYERLVGEPGKMVAVHVLGSVSPEDITRLRGRGFWASNLDENWFQVKGFDVWQTIRAAGKLTHAPGPMHQRFNGLINLAHGRSPYWAMADVYVCYVGPAAEQEGPG
jgi:hypothetical protein